MESPSRGRVPTAAAMWVPGGVLTGLPPLAVPSQQPQQDELGTVTQSEGGGPLLSMKLPLSARLWKTAMRGGHLLNLEEKAQNVEYS